MSTRSLVLGLFISLPAFAADFSPESFLGTLVSPDKKAKVVVYKEIVREADLFNPAKYEYFADISFDAGPCMEMYGNERLVSGKRLSFRYNGSWKPVEYLSTGFSEDSDYDGDVYLESASFTATKKGAAAATFTLDFSVGHNPDGGDGEDGGVSEFEACSKRTVSSWKLTKK